MYRRCRGPLVVSDILARLSDCLCHVSSRRYSPLSVEDVEKNEQIHTEVECRIFGRRVNADAILSRPFVDRG